MSKLSLSVKKLLITMGKLGLKQLQEFYNLGCEGEGSDQPVYLNS